MNRLECRVCGAATDAFCCKPCLNEIRRAVAELRSLRHEVSLLATGQTRVYRANSDTTVDRDPWRIEIRRNRAYVTGRPSGAERAEAERWQWLAVPTQLRSKQGRITLPATDTVVNLAARDLFDESTNMITTWARHLAESRNEEIPTPGRIVVEKVFVIERNRAVGPRIDRTVQPDAMPAVYGWLLRNLDDLRWDLAADDAHRELTGMHRRMTRAVDRSPSRLYAGPCQAELDGKDRCKAELFSWPPPRFDDDTERLRWERDNPILCDGYKPPLTDPKKVWHGGCQTHHERADRRTWLLDDLEDRLLPWSMLEDALPSVATDLQWPHRTTWWRWRKLVPAKTVIDGVEFFRGGDVIDLCRREQQRIKGNQGRAQRGKSERIAG